MMNLKVGWKLWRFLPIKKKSEPFRKGLLIYVLDEFLHLKKSSVSH